MKLFVVRDGWGYSVAEFDKEPPQERLNAVANLQPQANFSLSRYTCGWEDEREIEAGDELARWKNSV